MLLGNPALKRLYLYKILFLSKKPEGKMPVKGKELIYEWLNEKQNIPLNIYPVAEHPLNVYRL